MSTPIQWAFDLQEAMDVRDHLNDVLRRNRSMGLSWHTLKEHRDNLYELVSLIGGENTDEEWDDHYWHLWDALSYLTSAIAGHTVDVSKLIDARDKLDALFALSGEAGGP